MAELDFMNAFGAAFWAIMAVATVALIIGGYWLAGVIARKTDSGFGGFMIIVLVTILVASSFVPMAVFGAMGEYQAMMNPMAPIDETRFRIDSFDRIVVAAVVSSISVVAFFIASVIGLARERS